MSLKEIFINNAVTRLLLRIYRHFDTIPQAITIEHYRFYIISNILYTLAWGIHTIWFGVFFGLGLYSLMWMQLASIALHAVAIMFNRKGQHGIAMIISMSEIIGYQILSVYLLGWTSGFQYFIVAISLFPFLKHDTSWTVKGLLSLACVTSYLFLEIHVKTQPPVYALSMEAQNGFNYSNIIICFMFMATWGFFLTFAVQKTEAIILERNKALYTAEKATEQAELQRQLEVKERDMEIYRLRNVELKHSFDEIARRNEMIEEEKRRSEALLLNILPEEAARELLKEGFTRSRKYDLVTVMFTDFVGFTQIAESLKAEDLVLRVDKYFRAFDEITLKYGVEKIKTIGDAYMCAGGLPTTNKTNPIDVLNAAIEMIRFMDSEHGNLVKIRVGVHTGAVVAGVVGKHKFQYDIWGDAVNIAARMEQNSLPGRINISGATFELVKDHFNCEYRGKIEAKNKGEMEMYFVNGKTKSGIIT